MNGTEKINEWFQDQLNKRIMGHQMKYQGGKLKTEKTQQFLTQYIITLQNALPLDVEAKNLACSNSQREFEPLHG